MGSYTPDHLERDVLQLRDAQAGERKDVTVVLADVAGSLEVAAVLDPEDVHTLMDGFFALALDVVHAQGGTLNQFRGDGFMALFGAPRARGDDASRALRAALELRERALEYAASVRVRFDVPFPLRLGVSSGEVWVGAIGSGSRRDYTAEGPTVGLAARLEALAEPGRILVAEETVRRCGEFFEWRERGVRRLRGLAEPVAVFELLREGAARARLDVERRRGLTPLTGRGPELARLLELLEPAPGSRFVEVRGEAGVGKSRLVYEALARVPEAVEVLRAACREADARRAYLPWVELLLAWPGDAPAGETARELCARIEGHAGEPPAPGELEASVREVLGGLLARGPVVIALDDAQWLDASSRALVRALAARPPEGSLLWVATLRDEGVVQWAGSADALHVEPLGPRDARELAREILRDVDREGELAELACRRGGGNPLFVEEVARALRDGGESMREAAHLEIALQRSDARVPETIHGVVAARIDALPESAKRLLEAASVFPGALSPDLLAELEPSVRDPEDALRTLFRRGLVREVSEGRFDFCHGLIRSGAYAQLVRGRRVGLHRGAGEALERRPEAKSASGASRIASHFDLAGERERAVPYFLAAGRGYLRLRAFAEAAIHLRRGLELLREGEPNATLEVDVALELAAALNALDRAGEAAAVLEGVQLADARDEDRGRLALAAVQTGWARFSSGGEVDRATALLEHGLELAGRDPSSADVRLMAHSFLSRILNLDAEIGPAILHARRAVELAGARAERAGLVMALFQECQSLCDAGRVREARGIGEQLLELTADSDDSFLSGASAVADARLRYLAGDVAGALAAAERAEMDGRRSDQLGMRYNALATRGSALILGGDARGACETFEEMERLNPEWPAGRAFQARGLMEIGDYEGAARRAAECLEKRPPRMLRGHLLSFGGLATGLAGDARRAEDMLSEAISLFDRSGLRPSLAEAHGFLAELLSHGGDEGRASYYVERAVRGYEACEMHVHAARVRTATTRRV